MSELPSKTVRSPGRTGLMAVTSLIAMLLLTACPQAQQPEPEPEALVVRRGVNMAGADFGVTPGTLPGIYGTHYIYPHDWPDYLDNFAYFQEKGFNVVRLPFRWERLQRELFGELDADELERIKGFIEVAWDHDLAVIIDPHNYARYCDAVTQVGATYCGDERLIGNGMVTNEAFADFWSRLAGELAGNPGVWAYGLVNEPVYPLEIRHLWPEAAQAAIDAIRTVDMDTVILVPGEDWSGAYTWPEANPGLHLLEDPADNLIFEAHLYFNKTRSGNYDEPYDAEDDYYYPHLGADLLQPFLNWLAEHDARGFLGEYGVPGDQEEWLVVLGHFMGALDERCIGGTWWSAGPWWGDYELRLDPPAAGVDRPQMAVLEQHAGFECEVD